MATFVVAGRPLWLGSYALSDFAPSGALDYGADAVDDTVLADTTRSSAGGLKTVGFSIDSYADFGSSGPDGELFSNVATNVPLTFGSVDGTAQETAFLMNALQVTASPVAGTVGDMAMNNVTGNAASGLIRGTLEFNSSTASSGNSTGIQEGAVASGQRIYANLHVTAAAGSTLDVVIQSDNAGGFGSPTNVITFSQATGIGSQHLSAAGPVTDDYWRVNYTITGGSFTFAVAFGIL